MKGVPETDIRTIARGASFIGSLLLLYTIATGFAFDSSAPGIATSSMQQHTITGVVGTLLCIAGVAIMLRLK